MKQMANLFPEDVEETRSINEFMEYMFIGDQEQ